MANFYYESIIILETCADVGASVMGGYTMKWRNVNPKPIAVRGMMTVLGPDHRKCSPSES